MKILIMHQTVANHDAIGNDIEIMYNILKNDSECYVCAENKLNKNVLYADDDQVKEIINDRKALVIYHHSVYWENGEVLLEQVKGKIIFRYHNITPESFFEQYNNLHFSQCKKGREQTVRLIEKYPEAYWLSDSAYNAKDLNGVDKKDIGICAPFHKIEQWTKTKPDEKILQSLVESKNLNLLFVGRVAPNKGHLFLIEILRVFLLNYHNNIKLRIVGKFDDNLEGYNQLIRQKISQYHLENNIEFIGEINDATLASYYLGSDLFLCASEHEGFCVPILEAQAMGLPIVALDACAVPDTGGKGQILLQKDAKAFAAAIKILMENTEDYEYLQQEGYDNFEKNYTCRQLQDIFLRQIKGIMEE